jgi:hypothetical protein
MKALELSIPFQVVKKANELPQGITRSCAGIRFSDCLQFVGVGEGILSNDTRLYLGHARLGGH